MSRIVRGGVTRLIEGVSHFQQKVHGTKATLFRRLGDGQSPAVLFITCSDSRINPNLLTGTEPGELFVLRNAGNIVPPHAAGPTGEAATVEYAVRHLRVRDVVVRGHSQCGAVAGLLNPAALDALPVVRAWLRHAAGVADEAAAKAGAAATPADRLAAAVERNVLCQVANLKTHPAVAEAVAAGLVRVHAWVYRFETGAVVAHDPATDRFVPLAEAPRRGWSPADPARPAGGAI